MIALRPVRTLAPTGLPVSLEEAKAQLNYDDDDRDGFIQSLIATATRNLDGYDGKLGRCLVTQKWKINLGSWPCDRMARLPLAPASLIDSVKYYPRDDVDPTLLQTLTGTAYSLLEDTLSPYVRFLAGVSLPSLYSRDDAIEIIFTVGYGAAADVPDPIKAAILEHVATLFENRETFVTGMTAMELPYTAWQLIDDYRRVGF